MNCCTEYGQCNQGRDCPVRTGKVLPHQTAHAASVEAECCATEGGNVWFAEPEPGEISKLGPFEALWVYLLLVLLALLSLVSASGLAGYMYGRWLA